MVFSACWSETILAKLSAINFNKKGNPVMDPIISHTFPVVRQVPDLQVEESSPSLILMLASMIDVQEAKKEFIAKKKFTKENDSVLISAIWQDFDKWYLSGEGKIEPPMCKQILVRHRLQMPTIEREVLAELGGVERAACMLRILYRLLKKQGYGQKGPLLTDGKVNSFYIPDTNGIIRSVSASWFIPKHELGPTGWSIWADTIESRLWCGKGQQVFSPLYVESAII
jgi:hypothetical protein